MKIYALLHHSVAFTAIASEAAQTNSNETRRVIVKCADVGHINCLLAFRFLVLTVVQSVMIHFTQDNTYTLLSNEIWNRQVRTAKSGRPPQKTEGVEEVEAAAP